MSAERHIFVLDGIVITDGTVWTENGGVLSGPPGSVDYIVSPDDPVRLGWRCVINFDDYDPPKVFFYPPQ